MASQNKQLQEVNQINRYLSEYKNIDCLQPIRPPNQKAVSQRQENIQIRGEVGNEASAPTSPNRQAISVLQNEDPI